MSIVSASVIVVVTTTVAIAAMLVVRRRAPQGSYFEDGDRAAGVFGVLATGFALLSGFVIFLAFESYDTSSAPTASPGCDRPWSGASPASCSHIAGARSWSCATR